MRTRKAYRLPDWARIRIERIAKVYEITKTEALLRIIDQGSKWYKKTIRAEIKSDFDFTVEEPKPGVVLTDSSTNQEIMTSDLDFIDRVKQEFKDKL